jgi:phosphatidylglycerol---prolipoprotein diacylglyceryl transferase
MNLGTGISSASIDSAVRFSQYSAMSIPYLVDFDPIIFQIGPLALRWYGISYLLAATFAFLLAKRRLQEQWRDFSKEDAFDVCFNGLLFAIIGGRIGYVLFYDLSSYLAEPAKFLRVWEGGMSFHGGLLGVIVGTSVWAIRRHRRPLAVLDYAAALIPLGLGTVRLLGNFVGGELWGRKTDASIGMLFPKQPELIHYNEAALKIAHESGALNAFARHPSQLYQAFLEGVVLALVMWFYTRKPTPYRAAGGLFIAGYGVQRFIVEFFREPDSQLGFVALNWMSMGQLLSLPMIFFGIALMIIAYRANIRPEQLREERLAKTAA